jgi:hypothetical protein
VRCHPHIQAVHRFRIYSSNATSMFDPDKDMPRINRGMVCACVPDCRHPASEDLGGEVGIVPPESGQR